MVKMEHFEMNALRLTVVLQQPFDPVSGVGKPAIGIERLNTLPTTGSPEGGKAMTMQVLAFSLAIIANLLALTVHAIALYKSIN